MKNNYNRDVCACVLLISLAGLLFVCSIGYLSGQDTTKQDGKTHTDYGKAVWDLHKRCMVCGEFGHTPEMREFDGPVLRTLGIISDEPGWVHKKCALRQRSLLRCRKPLGDPMSLDIYLKPNVCPHCGRGDDGFSANITHNLGDMADAAGIYGILWHPEDNGITTARQLIVPLIKAVADMRAHPDIYKVHDSENGWGTYADFVPWLERLLEACEANPDARVEVSI